MQCFIACTMFCVLGLWSCGGPTLLEKEIPLILTQRAFHIPFPIQERSIPDAGGRDDDFEDFAVPQRSKVLNVVELEEPLLPTHRQFAERVLGTFDILPCAIGVSVDSTGRWRFHPFNTVVTDAIHERRLCFSTRLFDTEERLLKTLIRGMKYRGYGFRSPM